MDCRLDSAAARLVLEGPLTEGAELTPLVTQLPPETTVDLRGVTRINSSGVRRWISFITGVPPEKALYLENLPVSFVSQCNLIANFLGRARVRSLFVPVLCESCGRTTELLADAEKISAGVRPVPPPCGTCGKETLLDVMEDDYFAFLSARG